MNWQTVTGGTTGGVSSFGRLDLTILDVRLNLAKGSTQTFDLTISWSGVNDITIIKVTITEEYVLWFSLTETLPKQASKIGAEPEGTITIQMKVSVPWQITLGQHTISVTVSASQDGGITIEKSGVIYLTVTSGAPSVAGIPEIMTYLFLFAVVGLSGYAFIKKKR